MYYKTDVIFLGLAIGSISYDNIVLTMLITEIKEHGDIAQQSQIGQEIRVLLPLQFFQWV